MNKLEDYLNHTLEIEVDQNILQDIIALAVQHDAYESNKGYKHERVKYNERELAFFEQWQKENEPHSWINNGQGILQDLFIERENNGFTQKWVVEVSNRERMIVATVIQWLGSNVGMSFLHESLKRFGATITYDKQKAE